MYKRITSMILCLVLLWMCLPVQAEEPETLKIGTAQELLEFAESCRLDSYSQGLAVVLTQDIDLTDTGFSGIPIFAGSFDGAGHKISGIDLTQAGSAQGLFRYLTATAQVKDLQLQATVTAKGSRERIGALAGENAGQITGCTATVDVTGGSRVGGLVGINTVTGVIDSSRVSGTVCGQHFTGGIAGENQGVIRSCTNEARINTTPQENQVDITDITMDTLTNSEAINTVTDIGGIAGISSGVLRDCQNSADVGYRQMGYNIGGIAGTQSGYIVGCENRGHIQGRKEVGGIVGQMEPVAVLTYSRDTLQILEGQLGTMSKMVNQASAEATTGAAELNSQMNDLQQQADTAKRAADVLLGNTDTPPDADALLAAYSSLSGALTQMPKTVESIASTAKGTAAGLRDDLIGISGQINAMGGTLQSAKENLGAVIVDVSDRDTPEDLSGKVERCINYGAVLADMDAGGIAGAMAMETDLDVLEDLTTQGEASLDSVMQLRLVVLSCENMGTVTGKKQYAGGIVGGQLLGLVKDCTNTGNLEGEKAAYVGGICGLSTGTIRASYAKCALQAAANAGGIAGSGYTVTDCVAIVSAVDGIEQLGGILGSWEGETCENNCYLPVERDLGGIDGISYEGRAQMVSLEAFLQLEGLPEALQTVNVCFNQPDGTTEKISVPLGGQLENSQVPVVQASEGRTGRWEGLETAKLMELRFDLTFRAVYTPHSATIQTQQTDSHGRPLLLCQGDFSQNAAVSVAKSSAAPRLSWGQTLLECYSLELNEPGQKARCLLPEGVQETRLLVLVQDNKGNWQEAEFSVDGSYAAFAIKENTAGYAIVQKAFPYWIIAVSAAVLLAAAAVTVTCIRKKKKA